MAIFERLEALGLPGELVDLAVLTRLRWDHCYYLDRFKKAAIMVHERELRSGLKADPGLLQELRASDLGIRPPCDGLRLTELKGGGGAGLDHSGDPGPLSGACANRGRDQRGAFHARGRQRLWPGKLGADARDPLRFEPARAVLRHRPNLGERPPAKGEGAVPR
jgi:hypothetical protein